MDFGKIISSMMSHVFSGGSDSVIAILILGIAGLIYDRLRLVKKISSYEDKVNSLIDDYYKATITISEAFNSLKVVLTELKSKL